MKQADDVMELLCELLAWVNGEHAARYSRHELIRSVQGRHPELLAVAADWHIEHHGGEPLWSVCAVCNGDGEAWVRMDQHGLVTSSTSSTWPAYFHSKAAAQGMREVGRVGGGVAGATFMLGSAGLGHRAVEPRQCPACRGSGRVGRMAFPSAS